MNAPTFDSDGYPTEETLQAIREWPADTDCKYPRWSGLMKFIQEAWTYDYPYWEREGNTYHLSTGGWSGNESIIAAMIQNRIFWMVCWVSNRRGGHYEFEVKEEV